MEVLPLLGTTGFL